MQLTKNCIRQKEDVAEDALTTMVRRAVKAVAAEAKAVAVIN